MAKYRKRPVVVEAVQYNGDGMMADHNVPDWMWSALEESTLEPTNGTDPFIIHAFEGDVIVAPGDWIIKGAKDELYACKPDIFKKTYELVEE